MSRRPAVRLLDIQTPLKSRHLAQFSTRVEHASLCSCFIDVLVRGRLQAGYTIGPSQSRSIVILHQQAITSAPFTASPIRQESSLS